jgi:hypothetical protein
MLLLKCLHYAFLRQLFRVKCPAFGQLAWKAGNKGANIMHLLSVQNWAIISLVGASGSTKFDLVAGSFEEKKQLPLECF